jgi:hypothetical protein
MKLTIVDAMRLRNQLKNLISMRGAGYRNTVYGITEIDGVTMDIGQQSIPFPESAQKREKLFLIMEELNAKLTEHNQSKGIYKIVDTLQNKKDLLSMYNNAIPFCKPTKSQSFIIVGNERKQVVSIFTPFQSAGDIKKIIKVLRQDIRKLQSELDKLDRDETEVSFTEDEIDELETTD